MKLSLAVLLSALAPNVALVGAGASVAVAQHQPLRHSERSESPASDLWKRRGGGGSGGRGGGTSGGGRGSGTGSSGSGSGSSGGRGSTGGSSGSGGRTGGGSTSYGFHGSVLLTAANSSTTAWRAGADNPYRSSGRTSSGSSTGGRTSAGSGVAPAYGGGRYYGGGAQVPYRAAGPSSLGATPFLLAGAGAGLLFWPGIWYHPAYLYHTNPYNYHNATTNKNETKPVICACDETEECGCDNNTDTTYMKELVGNGSYAGLNQSQVSVADVNGTSTILVNGSLPNGTTASGGTDDDDDSGDDTSAGAGMRALAEAAGFWPVVATIGFMVFA